MNKELRKSELFESNQSSRRNSQEDEGDTGPIGVLGPVSPFLEDTHRHDRCKGLRQTRALEVASGCPLGTLPTEEC